MNEREREREKERERERERAKIHQKYGCLDMIWVVSIYIIKIYKKRLS